MCAGDKSNTRVHHSAVQDAFGSQTLISHSGRIDTVRSEADETIAKRVDYLTKFGNMKIANRTGLATVEFPLPIQDNRTNLFDTTIYSEREYTIRVSRLDPRTTAFVPAFIQKAKRAHFEEGIFEALIDVHRAVDTGICTQTSEEMFSMNTYYVFIVPNPEMFNAPSLKFFDNVPWADESLFNVYVSDTSIPQSGLSKLKVASGIILAGLAFAANSNQVLHLHQNEVKFSSDGMGTFPYTAFRNRKGVKKVDPLFCLLPQNTSMLYLRSRLLEYQDLYRYGRETNIIVNKNQDPALVSMYLNVDFVAAKASNLSVQRFLDFRNVRERLALSLEAYGFSNSQIDVHQLVEDEIRLGYMLSSEQKLLSFLVTAALTDALYDMILSANVDAFISWGTVVPNHITPFFNNLSCANPDRIVSEIMNIAYADSTYDEAIIELVKQVTVPLKWASYVPVRYKQKDIGCYYKLLEIMLAFQFYPR